MNGLVLLDTTVILHIVRGNETARRINAAMNLNGRPERPLISVVSIGEALGFAQYRGWGEDKMTQLRTILEHFVPVDINSQIVLEAYAAMHAHLVRKGRVLSDNDIWIAACALAASATLVTTDKDFDPLDGEFIQRVYFDS